MRTFVIGDVHGCIDEFRELVGMAGPNDRIIQLGDLMDRGPAQAECVHFARERGIEVVLGNHDDKHVRWRRHEDARRVTGKKNPMRPLPPRDAEQHCLLTDSDIAWLESRPVMLAAGRDFIAVHAGFEPGVPLDQQDPKKVTRVRYVDPTTGYMVSLEEGNRGAPAGSVPVPRPGPRRAPVLSLGPRPAGVLHLPRTPGTSVTKPEFQEAVKAALAKAGGASSGWRGLSETDLATDIWPIVQKALAAVPASPKDPCIPCGGKGWIQVSSGYVARAVCWCCAGTGSVIPERLEALNRDDEEGDG